MTFTNWIRSMALCLFACTASARALEVETASYNIRYGTAGDGINDWKSRKELLINQLREYHADTIGLQEALRFQIDEIRAALPHLGEVGIGREGGTKGEYSCILYDTRRFTVLNSGTFWLSKTPEKCSKDWDSACLRICTWALFSDLKTGETFYHFNTHLDHQSAEARLNSVQLIAQRIVERSPQAPFILSGDFNAAESSPSLSYLTKENSPVKMVDTFRTLHPDSTQVGTFNRFKADTSGAKIDYILTEPGIRVEGAKIDFSMPNGRCISDHFPVRATLHFAPAASADS